MVTAEMTLRRSARCCHALNGHMHPCHANMQHSHLEPGSSILKAPGVNCMQVKLDVPVLGLIAKARPGAAYEVMQAMLAQRMNTIKNPSAYLMSLLMKHRAYAVRNLIKSVLQVLQGDLQKSKMATSLLAFGALCM